LVALEKVRSLLDVSSVSVVVVRLLHAFSPTLSIGPALDVLDARSVAFVCVVYNGSNHLARRCGRLFRTRRVAPTGMDMQSDGKEAAACRCAAKAVDGVDTWRGPVYYGMYKGTVGRDWGAGDRRPVARLAGRRGVCRTGPSVSQRRQTYFKLVGDLAVPVVHSVEGAGAGPCGVRVRGPWRRACTVYTHTEDSSSPCCRPGALALAGSCTMATSARGGGFSSTLGRLHSARGPRPRAQA
jgi:hypothetical protein